MVGTFGDGGSGGDPENRAQDPDRQLGKSSALDVAAAQAATGARRVGLRNAWRFSFDRKTGDLWIGDVGPGRDRGDRLPATRPARRGPSTSAGTSTRAGRFEQKALGPGTLVQPIAQYTHGQGCSVTGGYVYRGKRCPRLAGRYFYGDYCSGTDLEHAGDRAARCGWSPSVSTD